MKTSETEKKKIYKKAGNYELLRYAKSKDEQDKRPFRRLFSLF